MMFGGLSFLLTDSRGWPGLVAAVAVVLLSIVVVLARSRARGTKWRAALDAYAEREIARDRPISPDPQPRRRLKKRSKRLEHRG
jgi:hypothetical protein